MIPVRPHQVSDGPTYPCSFRFSSISFHLEPVHCGDVHVGGRGCSKLFLYHM